MVHNLRGYGGFTQINNLFINRQYGGAPRPPMMGGSIWGGGCCPPPVSDGPGKGFWTAFGITAGLSFLGNLAAAIWGKKDGGQVQQQQQPYAQPYAQQMPYSYTPMMPGYTPRMQQPGIQQQNPTKTNLETAAKMYGYTIIETPDGKFMAISKDKGTVSGTFDEIINGMANGAKKPAEVVENNELSNANNQKNVKEKVNEQENENTPTENNKSKEVVAQENTQYKATKSKATNKNKGVNNKNRSYKTVSKTGRYTITKNGKTRYYAANGVELKQSYYEAKEAAEGQRNYSKNGSGRYSYTASNGETLYFSADGTPIDKKYYNSRETEFTAVKSQKASLTNARQAFNQQKASDGWAGKTADAISVMWNSDNRAVKVEADLKTYEQQVAALQKAQSQGAAQFNAKFKEIYGVNYNPANVAAYEANPTDENYRKAYGTKNNIHKRVMDYNKSQQKGAAAVKTTVVGVAAGATAIATGGTSLLATAAIAGTATMASRTVVEVTDLATNDIDGDVNAENMNNIAKQAMVEGVVAGATAGIMKGGSGLIGKVGTKAAPKNAPSSPTQGLVVRSNTASAKGVPAGATSTANNAAFAKSMAVKISSRGGLNNLTAAEKSKLSQIIGKNVDELKNLPKSEIRKLQTKFHPDKNPNNVEFAQDIFTIISNLV